MVRGYLQCYRSYRDLYVTTGDYHYLKLALDYVVTDESFIRKALG